MQIFLNSFVESSDDHDLQKAFAISLKPVAQPPLITVPGPLNPHIDSCIYAVSVKDFAMSREGFNAIVKPLITAGVIFILPGIGMVISGRVPLSPTLSGTIKTVVKTSASFFYSCFVPKSWTVGNIFSCATTYIVVQKLFKQLVIPSYCENYAAWKIARIETIFSNLLIPEKYQDDAILNKNVCNITMSPIRYPVKDKYGRYWEQPAICAWLVSHNTCPLTRKPLQVSDLTFDETLYQEITNRLEGLEGNSP